MQGDREGGDQCNTGRSGGKGPHIVHSWMKSLTENVEISFVGRVYAGRSGGMRTMLYREIGGEGGQIGKSWMKSLIEKVEISLLGSGGGGQGYARRLGGRGSV